MKRDGTPFRYSWVWQNRVLSPGFDVMPRATTKLYNFVRVWNSSPEATFVAQNALKLDYSKIEAHILLGLTRREKRSCLQLKEEYRHFLQETIASTTIRNFYGVELIKARKHNEKEPCQQYDCTMTMTIRSVTNVKISAFPDYGLAELCKLCTEFTFSFFLTLNFASDFNFNF